MRTILRKLQGIVAAFGLVSLLVGCAPLIADFNTEAYKNATSLKVEAMALVDKSGERFATRRRDVEVFSTKLDAAYEFAVNLPNNQESTAQWQIIRDPNGDYWGAFVKVWRQQGTMGSTFRTEYKGRLGKAFDQLICLETAKPRGTGCK
jgi:hypothetical protein